MEAAMNEVMNSIDPDVQDNFRKYADNKRPTPEKSINVRNVVIQRVVISMQQRIYAMKVSDYIGIRK